MPDHIPPSEIGPSEIGSLPAQALAALRAEAPLVQCITNFVAMNFAANAVLAAGAAPAMVHAAEEAGDFAKLAGALTVNIGTLSPLWVAGMEAAIAGAFAAGRPWVLDPVGHFATPYRASVAGRLLAQGPTILRGNASEILAFSGATAGRGVDAGDPVAAAMGAARDLAGETGGVVVVTGPEDFITDGRRAALVAGGAPMMARVTAMGCALTAVTGAFAAANEDPFTAALGACALFGAAGSLAAEQSEGPGSFAWRFLDALAAVQPDDLLADQVRAL